MKRTLGPWLASAFVLSLIGPARADEKDAKATLDKAITALGGAEKLGKAASASWKSKGKLTFGDGNGGEFSGRATVQGLDRYRSEFDGEFNGNPIQGVVVLDGDKGWRKFGENAREMDADAVANEKRNVYLIVAPATILPLRGSGFKVEAAGEEQVEGKPAAVVKATGPDGKDFRIYFDKESGLPVRQTARVVGFGGEEFDQETNFGGYKDFDGIKKATKVESRRNGEKFLELEISDFKALDKVEPETFAEPK